jgi:hypothetical protein
MVVTLDSIVLLPNIQEQKRESVDLAVMNVGCEGVAECVLVPLLAYIFRPFHYAVSRSRYVRRHSLESTAATFARKENGGAIPHLWLVTEDGRTECHHGVVRIGNTRMRYTRNFAKNVEHDLSHAKRRILTSLVFVLIIVKITFSLHFKI